MARKLRYKINLTDVFDNTFKDKERDQRSVLRRFISQPQVKDSFGREVIREIVKRTREKGIDKFDKNFRPYSKEYRKSLQFQIFKGGKRKPDLTLSGEMLASMQHNFSINGRIVTIDFVDQLNNDKAHGNIFEHGRDFFGLPEDVEAKILRDIVVDASRNNFIGELDTLIQDAASLDVQVGAQGVSIVGTLDTEDN